MAIYKGQLVLPSGSKVEVKIDGQKKITEHFTLAEIANPSCSEAVKFIISKEMLLHYDMLEEFRVKYYKKPIVVNCGYRSPSWNKRVGGVASSSHLKATATDLGIGAVTDSQWKTICSQWKTLCEKNGVIGEAIRYNWGVHLGSSITYQSTFYTADKR